MSHFSYPQIIDLTDLFQTIQFSISHLFALSLNVKQFYLTPSIGLFQVLPLHVRMDLRAMATKSSSTFPKAPALLETHYQII